MLQWTEHAEIMKSVLDPWIPLLLQRLKNLAAKTYTSDGIDLSGKAANLSENESKIWLSLIPDKTSIRMGPIISMRPSWIRSINSST